GLPGGGAVVVMWPGRRFGGGGELLPVQRAGGAVQGHALLGRVAPYVQPGAWAGVRLLGVHDETWRRLRVVRMRGRQRRVRQRWAARFISTTSSTVGLAGRAAKRSGRLLRTRTSLARSAAASAPGSSSRVSS